MARPRLAARQGFGSRFRLEDSGDADGGHSDGEAVEQQQPDHRQPHRRDHVPARPTGPTTRGVTSQPGHQATPTASPARLRSPTRRRQQPGRVPAPPHQASPAASAARPAAAASTCASHGRVPWSGSRRHVPSLVTAARVPLFLVTAARVPLFLVTAARPVSLSPGGIAPPLGPASPRAPARARAALARHKHAQHSHRESVERERETDGHTVTPSRPSAATLSRRPSAVTQTGGPTGPPPRHSQRLRPPHPTPPHPAPPPPSSVARTPRTA